MNKKLFTLTAIAALLMSAAVTSGYSQTNSLACNNRLIAGDYGFTLEGTKLGGPGPVGLQVGVAMTHFAGHGELSQIDSVTINGQHIADFTHAPASGSYSVNPNCTGTFNLEFSDGRPTVVVDFVVVDNGAEIDTVVVSAGGQPGLLATRSIGKRRFLW